MSKKKSSSPSSKSSTNDDDNNYLVDDLEKEIEKLQARVDSLTEENDNLKESRHQELSSLEEKNEQQVDEIEREAEGRLRKMEEDCKAQVAGVTKELDRLRSAFSGDSSGWIERKNRKGELFYENTESGDVQDEKPEVLVVADAMRKVEEAERQKEELEQLRRKTKENDTKIKKLDVSLNNALTDSHMLREMVSKWQEHATSASREMKTFNSFCNKSFALISAKILVMERKSATITKITMHAELLILKWKQVNDEMILKDKEIFKLSSSVARLESLLLIANNRLESLEMRFDEEVEKSCGPMRIQVATIMEKWMKEKIGRENDRKDMADLWPSDSGYILPTILAKFKTISSEEKAQRIKQLLERDRLRKAREEIRNNIFNRSRWEKTHDSYGRCTFLHLDNGKMILQDDLDKYPDDRDEIYYQEPANLDELGNAKLSDSDEEYEEDDSSYEASEGDEQVEEAALDIKQRMQLLMSKRSQLTAEVEAATEEIKQIANLLAEEQKAQMELSQEVTKAEDDGKVDATKPDDLPVDTSLTIDEEVLNRIHFHRKSWFDEKLSLLTLIESTDTEIASQCIDMESTRSAIMSELVSGTFVSETQVIANLKAIERDVNEKMERMRNVEGYEENKLEQETMTFLQNFGKRINLLSCLFKFHVCRSDDLMRDIEKQITDSDILSRDALTINQASVLDFDSRNKFKKLFKARTETIRHFGKIYEREKLGLCLLNAFSEKPHERKYREKLIAAIGENDNYFNVSESEYLDTFPSEISIDTLKELCSVHSREMAKLRLQVDECKENERLANDSLKICQQQTMVLRRENDLEIDCMHRNVFGAIDLLKKCNVENETRLTNRIVVLESNISEISREAQSSKLEANECRKTLDTSSFSTRMKIQTLQYEIERYRARCTIVEDQNVEMKNKISADLVKIGEDLRQERQHNCRLVVWIYAAMKDFVNYKKEIYELNKQLAIQKVSSKKQIDTVKQVFKEALSKTLCIGTDPDALFYFFAFSCANLAGSSQIANERLRSNGAVSILESLIRNHPVGEIKSLCLKSLMGMSWNRCTSNKLILLNIRQAIEHLKRLTDNETDVNSLSSAEVVVSTTAANARPRDVVKLARQITLRRRARDSSPNYENQKSIISVPSLLHTLSEFGTNNRESASDSLLLVCSLSWHKECRTSFENGMKNDTDTSWVQGLKFMLDGCFSENMDISAKSCVALANCCFDSVKLQNYLGSKCDNLIARLSALLSCLLRKTRTSTPALLEGVTALLSNLIAGHSVNSKLSYEVGLITMLCDILCVDSTSTLCCCPVDQDKLEQILGNTLDCLVNLAEAYGMVLSEAEIMKLVAILSSRNINVRKAAPLVVGNIVSKSSITQREIFGNFGAIEGLFMLLETSSASENGISLQDEREVHYNSLWSLKNISWTSTPNQLKCGKYLDEVINFIEKGLCKNQITLKIRLEAIAVLANSMYCSSDNRDKLIVHKSGSSIKWLVDQFAEYVNLVSGELQGTDNEWDMFQNCDRLEFIILLLDCIVSVSTVDNCSFWMITEEFLVERLLKLLRSTSQAKCGTFFPSLNKKNDCIKRALEIMHNFSLFYRFDTYQRIVAFEGNSGTAILVEIQGNPSQEVSNLVSRVLHILSRVSPHEEEDLNRRKSEMTTLDAYQLTKANTTLNQSTLDIQSLGLDVLNERLAESAEDAVCLSKLSSISQLLSCLSDDRFKNPCDWESYSKILMPSLDIIRTICASSCTASSRVIELGGIEMLMGLLQRSTIKTGFEPIHFIQEALLMTLVSITYSQSNCQDSSGCCRRVLNFSQGPETLLNLASSKDLRQETIQAARNLLLSLKDISKRYVCVHCNSTELQHDFVRKGRGLKVSYCSQCAKPMWF